MLKAKQVTFEPPLPRWKQDAIRIMGFGNMDVISPRLIVGLRDTLIGSNALTDANGRVISGSQDSNLSVHRPRRNVWSFNLTPVTGEPVLVSLLTGVLGDNLRTKPPSESIAYVRNALRHATGVRVVPQHIVPCVVRWKDDRIRARGAYAYMAKGATPDTVKKLENPCTMRYFSLESTRLRNGLATDGAFETGEAKRVQRRGSPGWQTMRACKAVIFVIINLTMTNL